MFYSYQQEYPTGKNESEFLKKIVAFINNYKTSIERQVIIDNKRYFDGNNVFIDKFKKMIWSDEAKRLIENIYAPNYKTSYNFLGNYVSQIVNSLYGETPTIKSIDVKTAKEMGFAGQEATKEALICGYSFTYEGVNDEFVVFNTENCIAFVDDETNTIVRFIRFWNRTINLKDVLYFEIYDEKGISTYINKGTVIKQLKEFEPYLKVVKKSSISEDAEVKNVGAIPIIIHLANKDYKSIFTPNLKYKVDLIDLIESGLANNIEEFSDVWMTVNVPGATQEQVQQIKETAKRAKAVIFAGNDDKNSVGFQTMEIPYQARQTAVNMLKEELVEDSGIIDFKQISGTATATEINARTYKLKQRVSNIEWYADKYFEELILLWQFYNNKIFEIDVTFAKLFINNQTELVNIANSLYDKISRKAFLTLLKQANVIDSVEDEILEQDKESLSKFSLEEIEDGQDAQGNGQEIASNQETDTNTISE